jgi:putative restriction endonuclease
MTNCVIVTERYFGEVGGAPQGTAWPNRDAVAHAGVHRPKQSGICGSGVDGAESIVVSGGYEDDEDYGDQII